MTKKEFLRFCSTLIAAVFLCHSAAFVYSVPFTRSEDGAVFSWHPNKKNKIAITFDDGPHKVYTPEILDILEEFGIKATFFVVGSCARENGEILRRAVSEGHEIANHTYTHKDLKSSPQSVIVNEILSTENAVYELCEMRTKLIRPPEGKYSEALRQVADRLDYKIVLWTVDTRDWAHTPSEQIAYHVLKNVKCGDIVLFHDFIAGNSPTPEALRIIIPELLDKGFSFVSVSELISSK